MCEASLCCSSLGGLSALDRPQGCLCKIACQWQLEMYHAGQHQPGSRGFLSWTLLHASGCCQVQIILSGIARVPSRACWTGHGGAPAFGQCSKPAHTCSPWAGPAAMVRLSLVYSFRSKSDNFTTSWPTGPSLLAWHLHSSMWVGC